VVAIVLGAAAAMSMPVVVWSGAVIKNDLAMACFQLAALYAGLRANKERQRGWLLVSAFLLGISFGVKPTAAFAAVPIGLIWVDGCLRRTDRMQSLVLVGLCFAFTASLWPVRTYALAGTPFAGVSTNLAVRVVDISDPKTPLNNLGRYIEIAIQAHIKGGDEFYEGPIRSPIGLIPAILAGAVLMWSRRRFNLTTRWVRVVGFGALFYWMSTFTNLRYGITPVVLLPFLLAPAFARALRLMRPSGEWALTMVIIYGFLFSLAPTLIISNSRPQLLNLAGLLSDDDYISTSFNEYPTVRALDGIVSQADDVLLIGSCLIGYAPYPWKVTCCSRRACSPERRPEKVAEGSYEYVIMPSSESTSTLGDDWSLLVAPDGASTAIYYNTSVQQQ
jgi:4-amino-4-deoxy-L-arabinose transferase-like glycosyltransferase